MKKLFTTQIYEELFHIKQSPVFPLDLLGSLAFVRHKYILRLKRMYFNFFSKKMFFLFVECKKILSAAGDSRNVGFKNHIEIISPHLKLPNALSQQFSFVIKEFSAVGREIRHTEFS